MINLRECPANLFSHFCLCIALTIGCLIAGCGGGSSDDSDSSDNTSPVIPAGTVQMNIELPEGSPLIGKVVSVDVYDNQYTANDDSAVEIVVSTETPTDAYAMLPPRDGDTSPTVYLFTTVLPDEEDISLNTESTAISLIMNAIPRSYLVDVTDPTEVKETIRQSAQPFIMQFQDMIKSDPYFLHLDNLDNVYSSTYMDGVQASIDALKSILEAKTITRQSAIASYRSALYEVTADLDLQVEPEYSYTGFRLDPIKEGSYVTGSISVSNDTSLYALITATDQVTGKELTPPLPQTMTELAFSDRLLSPQQGFWGGYYSNESTLDVMHRDVIINIATGGVKDLSLSEYTYGPASALQMRTMYSKVLMPSIETVLSIKSTAQRKAIFGIMHNSGVFDSALPSFYRGEITAGVKSIFDNLLVGLAPGGDEVWPNPVINEMLSYTLGEVLTVNSSFFVKIGLKTAAVKATIAIWVSDMASVYNDLLVLPANITSNVNFPIDLSGMQPTAISRRSGSIIENEEITLSGFGFKTIQHATGGYFPIVNVNAMDKTGETVDTLELYPPTTLTMSDDGTQMQFTVLGQWLNTDSTVETIEVSIDHHYTARDSVDRNILHDITLPLASNRSNFIINIGGMIISSLDKTKAQGNDTLAIRTAGVSSNTDLYTVSFETRSGNIIPASIIDYTNNVFSVEVPHYDDMEVGPISVFIEDRDGLKSNKANLVFIPEKIEFLPGTPAVSGEIELGITQPQGLPDIFYSLNNGTEYSYSAPITVPDLTNISAWVIKTVDGVDYASEKSKYTHSMCEEGEEYLNGECVSSCTRVCNDPVISNTVTIPSVGGLHEINMTFEQSFKYCLEEVDNPHYSYGKVTMLYFYTWEPRTASEWEKLRESNGGSLPYNAPSKSPSSYFNMGTLSINGTHTDTTVYMTAEPEINSNSNYARYNTPEDLFGMVAYNYEGVHSGHENDFLRVRIVHDVSSWERLQYITVINPEVIKENGCYEGDY